jgi:hypothetical protein
MDIDKFLTIIGTISPSLAAYHYSRSQPKQTADTRCPRCGHLLRPGLSHSRLVRSSAIRRKDNVPLSLRQTCATCGHINNTLLHPVNHNSLFQGSNVTTPPPSLPYPTVTATPHPHGTDQPRLPDPPPDPPSHMHPLHPCPPSPPHLANPQAQPPSRSTKSRPKHKAGLKEMLARNKERQHEAVNRGSSGLATFLHTL